ncbi:MAG TPA: GLPGLI family protein [Chitinophagaceae bacterium]|nr:GLPGLI family protein [Chitinophagaceae bacterium]
MKYLLIFGLLLAGTFAHAQTQFLAKGKIEFERKINVHRQYEPQENDSWFKEYISKLPKFHTSYFDLYFSDDKTVYKHNRDGDGPKNFWGIGPSKENTIMVDLSKGMFTGAKRVFEENYLIQDSTRKLEWKISDETRTIAGFECRKAVGKICDSVYVVAFYTDEILVSGGPESFNGLPGMILGLAIPRLYTTWFATKVQLIEPKDADLAAPTRGKKVNHKALEATLQKSLKDWGKEGQRNIWWVML